MTSIWPGEQLLARMWETIAERGIGGLLRPWQLRREGSARADIRREELLVLAQAEKDAVAIRDGSKEWTQGTLISVRRLNARDAIRPSGDGENVDSGAMINAAIRLQVADAVRKEINVTRALLEAENVLSNDSTPPPDDKIDDDWLVRWRDNASTTSVDELQKLWGRVLAGEVKSPGTFSLRTLEFLKCLTKGEAELIARMMRFAINYMIARNVPEILDAEGMDLAALLRLQALGVISGVDSVGMNAQLASATSRVFERALESNGKVMVVRGPDAARTLVQSAYFITDLGIQLKRLGNFEPHEKYLKQVGAKIKASGFQVELADLVGRIEGRIEYRNAIEL